MTKYCYRGIYIPHNPEYDRDFRIFFGCDNLRALQRAGLEFDRASRQVQSQRGWGPNQEIKFRYFDIDVVVKVAWCMDTYKVSLTADADREGEKWNVVKDLREPRWFDFLNKMHESIDMQTVKEVLDT